jgi:hypothetical protein
VYQPTADDERYFAEQLQLHETSYLAGTNPRQQCGFGRDERDWEQYRRCVAAPVDHDGSYLDIGCANGLLMETAVQWAAERGCRLEPYGLEISNKLTALARSRLPQWHDRIFVGNALTWKPPFQFDYVRTELVYVPRALRRHYIERLLTDVVAQDGRLILCSYGSSRPEGNRAELLINDVRDWQIGIESVHDARDETGSFVVTRVISIRKAS